MPDELYRTLKARAALNGIPLRELVQFLIESGLRSGATTQPVRATGRGAPPVIIAPLGKPIRALSADELKLVDEAEDLSRHARSS